MAEVLADLGAQSNGRVVRASARRQEGVRLPHEQRQPRRACHRWTCLIAELAVEAALEICEKLEAICAPYAINWSCAGIFAGWTGFWVSGFSISGTALHVFVTETGRPSLFLFSQRKSSPPES
jgi:hypothetical protein